jgi:hypothetical protein
MFSFITKKISDKKFYTLDIICDNLINFDNTLFFSFSMLVPEIIFRDLFWFFHMIQDLLLIIYYLFIYYKKSRS